MIGQAGRRNASGIRQGRIDLRQGDVSALPYENNTFDKVYAINSLHHWPAPVQGLKECWCVLKPGGLLAIMEQPHGDQSEAAVRQRGNDLVGLLAAAGFRQPAFILRSLSHGPVVYVTGFKAAADNKLQSH
jgi:SAM-dependent methyltransferase